MDEQSNALLKYIGVISDTHNLLRPEAVAALKDVDLIIHAGDICRPEILDQLKNMAPVTAVRGNHDHGAWADKIPIVEMFPIDDVLIYIIHDLAEMTIDPAAAGVQVVISGHSHQPSARDDGGVLYLNPGSAGQRRFKLPVSLAYLRIAGKTVSAEIVQLSV